VLARRLAFLVVLATLFAVPAPGSAAIDAGPRLAFVEWLAEPPMTRLSTVGASGSDRVTVPLAGVQPVPFEGPAFSPDGGTLVFAGYPVGPDGEPLEESPFRLFTVNAEGGGPREIPGTLGGSRPVLSRDGLTVAFVRGKLTQRYDPRFPLKFSSYFSQTAWVVDVRGGKPRRLTPWRNGLSTVPASFSPDGSTLLLERNLEPGFSPEVISRPLAGGSPRLIARRSEQPAYSPDGSRIALISYRDGFTVPTGDAPAAVGELYAVDANGGNRRRLTRTPTVQESQPSWSPSGARIAFVRVPGPGGLGFGSSLIQANADGSCARRVTGSEGRRAPALYGPAWQPGPGREATPLSC
jgi:Tol biopolymer transport system component